MKNLLAIAAIAAACLITAPRAHAQSAAFVYSGVPSAPITPGSSFTISVSLVFTAGGGMMNVNALSYWMWQPGATAGNPNFQITNYDSTGSVFNMGGQVVYPQILDPISRSPTGGPSGFGGMSFDPQPSGTYFIANITFQALSTAPPGTYTIGNTTSTTPSVGGRISVINDSNGNTLPIAASNFTVTIVPEPGTVSLLILGTLAGGVIGVRRRQVVGRN